MVCDLLILFNHIVLFREKKNLLLLVQVVLSDCYFIGEGFCYLASFHWLKFYSTNGFKKETFNPINNFMI